MEYIHTPELQQDQKHHFSKLWQDDQHTSWNLHFSLVSASNRTRQNCKMQMNFSSAVVWFLIVKSDICLSWASLVKYIHTYIQQSYGNTMEMWLLRALTRQPKQVLL
jgi:hypothetical protein